MRNSNIKVNASKIFLLALASCTQVRESDFFAFPVKEIDDIKAVHIQMDRNECAADLYCAAINDGTIYSYESSKEWIFTLTDIGTNEISGTFCKRGRGPEEFINVFPLQDFYIEDRETKTLLFSYYDARLVTWNISKSMETGADVYEDSVHINDSTKYFPLGSIHRLNKNEMLVLDTRQNPKVEKMTAPPVYYIYNMTSWKTLRKYDLFNNPCMESKDNALYTSRHFLSLHDCIKPDGTRVAMAMGFFPQINILDIHTGECLGFRIKGATRFSPEHHTWHFTSAAADSRFIYALYYGKSINNEDYDACPDLLYVFDWQGNIVSKLKLDEHVTDLYIDNNANRLYLSHRMRPYLYSIDLGNLLKPI